MSVTEHERHQLYNWFEENMGPERAETMMKLVPPVGWGDVATRDDLLHLKNATHYDIQQLKADIHQLEQSTGQDFSGIRDDLAALEGRIELELSARLEAAISKAQRTFIAWVIASQTVFATIIGSLVAIG